MLLIFLPFIVAVLPIFLGLYFTYFVVLPMSLLFSKFFAHGSSLTSSDFNTYGVRDTVVSFLANGITNPPLTRCACPLIATCSPSSPVVNAYSFTSTNGFLLGNFIL